jgi:hypothetical protein
MGVQDRMGRWRVNRGSSKRKERSRRETAVSMGKLAGKKRKGRMSRRRTPSR